MRDVLIAIGLFAGGALSLAIAVDRRRRGPLTADELSVAHGGATGDVEGDIAYGAFTALQRWPRTFFWIALVLGIGLIVAGILVLAL